jgi:hypothetical protein
MHSAPFNTWFTPFVVVWLPFCIFHFASRVPFPALSPSEAPVTAGKIR